MRRRGTPRGAVLVGFMGAGKSSVGKVLARRLGAEFLDVDERIEDDAGKTVEEIFATEGEQAFRGRERMAIRDAVSVPGRVIATGGGSFLDDDNRKRLRAYAPVVLLDISPATALARLAGDTLRPLLSGEDREKAVTELMERRRPAYRKADFRVSTENLTAARVAEKVFLLLSRGSQGVPAGRTGSKERRRG
ncbi:MAG: shikimate kinase [Candidatus Deferrimicrobiaceae bacterium]